MQARSTLALAALALAVTFTSAAAQGQGQTQNPPPPPQGQAQSQSQGGPKYLDLPDGPLARGVERELVHGSRADALSRHRERQASDTATEGQEVGDAI